jgi:hypothetical protein
MINLVRQVAGKRFDEIELAVYIWYFEAEKSARDAATRVDRGNSLSIDDLLASPFTLLGSPE